MITLNMSEALVALTVENAALLPPCSNQSSRLRAEFYGSGAGVFIWRWRSLVDCCR
jgi:hypothetical protein